MHELAFTKPDREREKIACPWCSKTMYLGAIDSPDAPEGPDGLALICEHRPDEHVIRLGVSAKGHLP